MSILLVLKCEKKLPFKLSIFTHSTFFAAGLEFFLISDVSQCSDSAEGSSFSKEKNKKITKIYIY